MKRFYSILISCLIGLTANGQETKTIDSFMVLIPAGEFIMGKDYRAIGVILPLDLDA